MTSPPVKSHLVATIETVLLKGWGPRALALPIGVGRVIIRSSFEVIQSRNTSDMQHAKNTLRIHLFELLLLPEERKSSKNLSRKERTAKTPYEPQGN
jgi:hypothetical protein